MSAKTQTMMAVVTVGHGGYDKLVYRCVAKPVAGPDEVVLRVLAAGVNNTEINTRLGWYAADVTADTQTISRSEGLDPDDGGWNGATPFPLIQGTDCCGIVAEVGANVPHGLIGQRGLVRACMRVNGFDAMDTVWMASNFDGAFAQFVKVPAAEFFPVATDWSDAELATIPCAYGTAENMLHRANVGPHDVVLVAGASGGVGSATVQLAKRRGARVIAITSQAKMTPLRALGADQVVDRAADLVAQLGENRIDVVVDNVGGPNFAAMLKVLKYAGRYLSSGAIAGPVVQLDMRDMYLKDIRLIGCTAWDAPVFPNLVSYIENNEIRPLVAREFALADIVQAQKAFMEKAHLGNFVLIPPPVDGA